jgi:CHASE3 domain sensor protein
MKKFLSENWIVLVIGVAFITSTVFAIRNNGVIKKNQISIQQSDMVKRTTQAVLTQIMHGIDLGVRGYGLTHDEKLLVPYHKAIAVTPTIFHQIDSLLAIQNYPAREDAAAVRAEIAKYISFSKEMISLASHDDMESFTRLVQEDRGYQVWAKYSSFSEPLFVFEDRLNHDSLQNYQSAIQINLLLQICILVLGLPMLYFFVSRVNLARKQQHGVLKEVDSADRTFVFNDGQTVQEINESVNTRSLQNVKRASEFVAALASDDYSAEWNGLSEGNSKLNEKTLAGNLIRLRERLKQVKQDDEKRNWLNEGLTRFSEIVRTNQQDPQVLIAQSISFLTKYIRAQQGSLFIVEGEAPDEYLKLEACFAFERKKYVEKRIEIGEGLIGQVYLEGQPVILKEVPNGYVKITSGLGEATPSCIAIIPMRHEESIAAVAEFASFDYLSSHQISFLQKAGEFLAVTLINSRNTVRMKALLEEAALREVMMREREEELKQNMEELQATQEQLARNYREKSSSN